MSWSVPSELYNWVPSEKRNEDPLVPIFIDPLISSAYCGFVFPIPTLPLL